MVIMLSGVEVITDGSAARTHTRSAADYSRYSKYHIFISAINMPGANSTSISDTQPQIDSGRGKRK